MNPYWYNIFRSRGYEQSLAFFLGTLPMFKTLNKQDLAFLENIVHIRKYQADEMVFSEGDIGSGMYTIRSGQVQIYTSNEHGQETEQAILETGDFFGEAALTASRPRCAAARTTGPTVLIGLFRSDMVEAMRRQPVSSSKILFGLNRVISDRLLQCSIQLEEIKKTQASSRRQQTDE